MAIVLYFIQVEDAGTHITVDPLVVGIKNDQCYLVDKFDTTPLERYVAEKFTS